MKSILEAISATISAGKPAAEPDAFDPVKLPFGVSPGGNKFGLTTCPFCRKPATETGDNQKPQAFLFRDDLSAMEYRISGLCQSCQDKTFGNEEG